MSDPTPPTNGKQDTNSLWLALKLAWELGYLIAIPVVILGIGGAYADKLMGTSPLFTLGGFLLAAVTSGYSVYKRVKEVSAAQNPTL